MERGVEVQSDDEVPFIDREFFHRGDMLHPRIVDEDVHAAKGLRGGRHHGFDRIDLGKVRVAVTRARSTDRLQRLAFRLDGIGIAKAVDDDIGALGRQRLGISKPDPRRGTGDQCCLALQNHAFFSLRWSGRSRSNADD